MRWKGKMEREIVGKVLVLRTKVHTTVCVTGHDNTHGLFELVFVFTQHHKLKHSVKRTILSELQFISIPLARFLEILARFFNSILSVNWPMPPKRKNIY